MMHSDVSSHLDFEEWTLENGLRVILCPSHRTPLVHISLHYRVGSSHEEPGQSGFAHLFEHMMFQGSKNVGKNEHGIFIDKAGGRWNASTSKDRTNYYATLPAHYLELALWLEADRMRSLEVTEENFENQRQTVIEEKKQSYDNRPYGLAHLRFDELAYSNWAYAHPIIGAVEDLEKATVEDARAFHEKFYGPGNATLVLAGDLVPDQALAKVREYFGDIDDRTAHFEPDLREDPQQGEKRENLEDPLALLPAVSVGYHMAPLGSDEYYAASLLSLILSEGDSSRFDQKFLHQNSWVTGVYSGSNQYKGPQLFCIWAQLQAGVSSQSLLEGIDGEFQDVAERGITPNEMEKATNQIRHRFVARMAGVSQIGELLASYATLYGDPAQANRQLDRFLSVTPEDIRNFVIERLLKKENRTVLTVHPAKNS